MELHVLAGLYFSHCTADTRIYIYTSMSNEVTPFLETCAKKLTVEPYSCVKIQTTLGMNLETVFHNYVDGEPTWTSPARLCSDRWRAHLEGNRPTRSLYMLAPSLGSITEPVPVLPHKTN